MAGGSVRGDGAAPADPVRRGREQRRVPARWVAPVHLRPPGPGRQGRRQAGRQAGREAAGGAVAPPRGGRRGPAAAGAGRWDHRASRSLAIRARSCCSRRCMSTSPISTPTASARRPARTPACRRCCSRRYPIRYWDHYLGPRDGRYFVAEAPRRRRSPGDAEDLTGPSGTALPEPNFDIAPDGRSVATTWRRFRAGATGDDIVVIDRSTRERRNLTGDIGWSAAPAFSPDGRQLAVARGRGAAPDVPERFELVVYDLESGDARVVAGSLDRWPVSPRWTPDGAAILFTADDEGGVSIYRVDLASDAVTRLAGGAAFSDIAVSPDGGAVFALRASPDRPPHVVRLDARAADQDPVEVRSPATPAGELPRTGVLERLSATADDGVAIGSWLLRPAEASREKPAPLVVFVHGGPLGTWAGWSWRWNANLLVERGYAVLMPDPALSTGYGQAFIDRGWGTLGRAAVHGRAGRGGRRAGAPRHRRDADRADGRLVRWLHGQLGRRPHRPLQGDRHPRLAVGAARLPRHDRRRDRLGAGDRQPVRGRVPLPRQLPVGRPWPTSRPRCS